MKGSVEISADRKIAALAHSKYWTLNISRSSRRCRGAGVDQQWWQKAFKEHCDEGLKQIKETWIISPMIRNTMRRAKQTHGERPTSKTLRRGDSIIIFANMDRETWTKWEDWIEEARSTTHLPQKTLTKGWSKQQCWLQDYEHLGHMSQVGKRGVLQTNTTIVEMTEPVAEQNPGGMLYHGFIIHRFLCTLKTRQKFWKADGHEHYDRPTFYVGVPKLLAKCMLPIISWTCLRLVLSSLDGDDVESNFVA